MNLPKPEEIPDGHPWEETRDLQPMDRKLRLHGFKIEQRAKGRAPVWSRNGQMFEEQEAQEIVHAEIAEAVRLAKAKVSA